MNARITLSRFLLATFLAASTVSLAAQEPPDFTVTPAERAAAIDGAIGRMADRVVHRATTAGMHAAALRGMIDTFPTPRPEGADLTAAATWQTMLRDHARGFVRETEATRGRDSVAFLGRASTRTTIDDWNPCESLR